MQLIARECREKANTECEIVPHTTRAQAQRMLQHHQLLHERNNMRYEHVVVATSERCLGFSPGIGNSPAEIERGLREVRALV